MRELKVDLSKHKNIKGELIIGIPKYRQRLKMMKDCNFKLSEDGSVNVSTETLQSIITLTDMAQEYFTKVDLKCGDIHVKSFDEMENYSEFDGLISECATLILNAGKLGK